jgi:large subunit ribosomal protein L9
MKVIFLQDVVRVGKKYDVKEVNDGYAMNFLIPKKIALLATPKAIIELEKRKKSIEIERRTQTELLIKNLEEIQGKIVIIRAKADEKGHLFSGIKNKEIIKEMHTQHHANISEESIILEKPIKEIGEFEIPISIQNKKSSFKLKVERI